MKNVYGRDLDLNLLRVFVVVAEAGSVTEAARRLYLTQPAISAALKRLASSVGAPLFSRAGRGLVLTARGERLLVAARPSLESLVRATLWPSAFDPKTSERTIRLGLADAMEAWLLPALVRAVLLRDAPHMRLVVVPVQFRTVPEALALGRIDLAVTVADDVPAGVRREPLLRGRFVCLYDPKHARIGRGLTKASYLAHEHVVVSYNGDLRGIVEDLLGVQRRARVSVPTFHTVGALVEGTPLLATIPENVAREILRRHRGLRTAKLPFPLGGATTELLTRAAVVDDEAVTFVRQHIVRIANEVAGG